MIDKDLIPQSHLWTLNLLIGPSTLEVVALPPVDADEIIYRSIPLDPAAPSTLKALEDAIYDNPGLLNQYRSVTVALDTDAFTILPLSVGADIEDIAARGLELTQGEPVAASKRILRAPSSAPATALFFVMDGDMAGFLRRTFFNVTLTHPLAILGARLTAEPGRPVLTAAFRPGNRLDFIALGTDRNLIVANTYSFEALPDAAYYIYAAARHAEMTAPTIMRSLNIAAPASTREALIPILSRITGLDAGRPAPAFRRGQAASAAPLCLILPTPPALQ